MKRRILFASFAASLIAAFLMPVAASAAAQDASWKDFGQEYKNQGQCVKDVKSHDHDRSHDNWDD